MNPRTLWWSFRNRARGYRFGPVQRFRCCAHTTPFHYSWCAARSEIARELAAQQEPRAEPSPSSTLLATCNTCHGNIWEDGPNECVCPPTPDGTMVAARLVNRRPGPGAASPPRTEPSPSPKGRYRKKPVVIEAMRYEGEANRTEVMAWCGATVYHPVRSIYINTLEGTMRAAPGDWIVRGIKGEFYPVRADIFDATYEPETQGVEVTCARCGLKETRIDGFCSVYCRDMSEGVEGLDLEGMRELLEGERQGYETWRALFEARVAVLSDAARDYMDNARHSVYDCFGSAGCECGFDALAALLEGER